MSQGQKPVYWLLDFEVPSFITKFGRDEFKGIVLIASRQLWNLISEKVEPDSESIVRSALIGPGYIKGVVKKGTGGIEFEHAISSVIFNPAELRLTEPLPLLNIISPEVVDPSAESSIEEIEGVVRKVMVARGNPLVPQKIAEVRPLASIPTLEYTSTAEVKLEIRLTSGLSKARFVLQGVHKRIYAPYCSRLSGSEHYFDDPSVLNVFWVDKRQLIAPPRESLSDWTIIEKSGERQQPQKEAKDGYDEIMEEYRLTYGFMKAHLSSYVLT
jgi:hypothetical protein